jgi:hypothetical protein
MKRIVSVLPALVAMAVCVWPAGIFAGDVPNVSVAEFADSPESAFIWQLLAGQGAWGAVLFAIIGVVWKFAKPYLDEWMRQRKLTTLWNAVTTGVVGSLQTYVDAAKASNGGKLTAEMAAHARDMVRSYVIAFMKAQGVDVIREYGQEVLDYMIEAILRLLKIDNAVLKAVATPLSASASLPIPELAPGMPAKTAGVSG